MAAEPKKTARRRLTPVSTLHYVRLVYRSVLFLLLALQYILFRMDRQVSLTALMEQRPLLLTVAWAVFVVEMILRFFPSPLESPGCQKQFAQNYIKSGSTDIHIEDNNATLLVALVWIMFNGVFGALHMAGILDDGIMILLCVAYSVCDMICILFFCPFQTWFMKNKCCSTCRIYNWDYAMMFTRPCSSCRRRTPGASSPSPWPCWSGGSSPSSVTRNGSVSAPTTTSAARTARRSSAPTRNSCSASGSISRSIPRQG